MPHKCKFDQGSAIAKASFKEGSAVGYHPCAAGTQIPNHRAITTS